MSDIFKLEPWLEPWQKFFLKHGSVTVTVVVPAQNQKRSILSMIQAATEEEFK